jgi:hypothetical protein
LTVDEGKSRQPRQKSGARTTLEMCGLGPSSTFDLKSNFLLESRDLYHQRKLVAPGIF